MKTLGSTFWYLGTFWNSITNPVKDEAPQNSKFLGPQFKNPPFLNCIYFKEHELVENESTNRIDF